MVIIVIPRVIGGIKWIHKVLSTAAETLKSNYISYTFLCHKEHFLLSVLLILYDPVQLSLLGRNFPWYYTLFPKWNQPHFLYSLALCTFIKHLQCWYTLFPPLPQELVPWEQEQNVLLNSSQSLVCSRHSINEMNWVTTFSTFLEYLAGRRPEWWDSWDSAGTWLLESHSSSGLGFVGMCGSGSGKLLTSGLFLPGRDSSILQGRERKGRGGPGAEQRWRWGCSRSWGVDGSWQTPPPLSPGLGLAEQGLTAQVPTCNEPPHPSTWTKWLFKL